MLGTWGWMTSWTGSDADDGGPFLFCRPLPGGLGITAVAEVGYKPWLSVSWYSAACLASASFFPTTNLGNGRSLTGETGIRSGVERKGLLNWFSRSNSHSKRHCNTIVRYLSVRFGGFHELLTLLYWCSPFPSSCPNVFSPYYWLPTFFRMTRIEAWTCCNQVWFTRACRLVQASEENTWRLLSQNTTFWILVWDNAEAVNSVHLLCSCFV